MVDMLERMKLGDADFAEIDMLEELSYQIEGHAICTLLAARHEHFPHVRMEGWKPEDRPVAFTTRQSHYSINRGAMVCGMGMN